MAKNSNAVTIGPCSSYGHTVLFGDVSVNADQWEGGEDLQLFL